MGGRLFSLDAVTKAVEHFHWDPATAQFTITDVQDVEPILDNNRAQRNEATDRHAFARKIASVPENIYWHWQMKWRNEGRTTAEIRELWKKFLNDPDHSQFKTTEGRI